MGSFGSLAPASAEQEFTILTPNAMLGYGYRQEHFWYGVTRYKPAAIIVDSGSTDGGPYKLGMNKMTCGRGSYVRDLEPILDASFHYGTKVLIGSVGGDGSTKHVSEMLDIVTEIAQRKGYRFKVATIDAGINRDLIKRRIAEGKVGPCGPVDPLLPEVVDGAVDVVAQMGAEPYIEALKSGADIILGGRSYDPAPFAAFCLLRGVAPGVAWHMGKIMECGGICAVPKGRSMIATMRHDSFDLTPLAPEERCTPLSVASHTLYEKTRPDRLPGPGGVLNLDKARYEQITAKTTRISGAIFEPSLPCYQIKLEGVTHLGFRTIFIGGIRDPILIGQIDDFLERVRKYTENLFPELDQSEKCRLIYHIYGKNGVMGPLEAALTSPEWAAHPPHEIAILGEVVAPTQEQSYTIANNARASILHFSYPGQMATTGNFASPLSPHEQAAGAVFKFSLYHLVDLEPGEEVSLFPVTLHELGSAIESPTPAPLALPSKVVFDAIENGKLAPLTYKTVPEGPATMEQLARIVRSKNSGPFELTFDIMFDSVKVYERVKAADVLTNDMIKQLYHVKDDDIVTNMYFDPALAWKCTIVRPWAQGSVGERDTLGTQQHAPLLGIQVPAAVAEDAATPVAAAEAAEATAQTEIVGSPSQLSFPDRTSFSARDIVIELWSSLGLPHAALSSLSLPGDDPAPSLPSSFKIGQLAQSTIALSALAAAQVYSLRNGKGPVPRVEVDRKAAAIEYKSERVYVLDGKPAPSPWGPIGGLHPTSDGYVRIHDSFPNHRDGALDLLGLKRGDATTRADVSAKTKDWASIDLENEGLENKLCIYALRSYRQWDALPQSRILPNIPVAVTRIGDGPYGLPVRMGADSDRSLRGLRVLELSRVIAAPLAGKTLAAHGADVIWVTSPGLPDLPTMDRDFGRGKRTVQLDMRRPEDKAKLLALAASCDVFIQGYRPGSVAAHDGFSPEELAAANPGIVIANMSAFGPSGPWAGRRGFDSLVQTCSGMNVSEAEHYGAGEAARPTPCQALDHAGGYLLATGVIAALYQRALHGGSYRVDVSLAGCMKYLRSMGQYPGHTGFNAPDYNSPESVTEYLEERDTGFGVLKAVRHSAKVAGCEPGWDVMPKPLGSDKPEWLL